MPSLHPPNKPSPPELQLQLRHDNTTDVLPPLYSPHPHAIPVSRVISELDLNALKIDYGSSTPSASTSTTTDSPPSIISPAYTPPSTPGTTTSAAPTTHTTPPTSVPAPAESTLIPIDSTLPNGGCGPKHPRLLPHLPTVRCIVRARIPTTTGTEMFLHLYQNSEDNKEHLAIVFGGSIRSMSLDAVREGESEMDRLIRGAYRGRLWPGRSSSLLPDDNGQTTELDVEEGHVKKEPALVRIHSECYTGETVWSTRCDCGEQLDEAARLMSLPAISSGAQAPGGVIIYLRQEGRGIGLGEKLKAYNLQDLGSDTVEANLLLRHPADARSYGLATAMLLDLGVREVRLLTNNPEKVRAVEGPEREVVVAERVPMVPLAWKRHGEGEDEMNGMIVVNGLGKGIRSQEIGCYLRTKIERMGHMLSMGEMN